MSETETSAAWRDGEHGPRRDGKYGVELATAAYLNRQDALLREVATALAEPLPYLSNETDIASEDLGFWERWQAKVIPILARLKAEGVIE